VVIVDEVSMLELELLDLLIERAAPTTHLVLVGDPDQLASVNVGAVLRDIVDAAAHGGALETLVTTLTVNFRSGDEIQRAAEAVNAGSTDALIDIAHESGAAVTLTSSRERSLVDALAHARALVAASDDAVAALEQLDDFVILAAAREGPGSVAWWRDRVGASIVHGPSDGRFTLGEPVLVTRNEPADPSEEGTLTNGDVGVVVRGDDQLDVVFGPLDALRRRRVSRLPDAEVAYAMTIHKSQGSEYDRVVISLPDHVSPLLSRELVYTALTRARQHVTLIASSEVLRAAIDRRIDRVSSLRERVEALSHLTGSAVND